MRKISYITGLGLILAALAMPAVAQDKDNSPKQQPPQKAEKAVPKSDDTASKGTVDLDKFFKRGEENAKNGASCDKPATPADPIA